MIRRTCSRPRGGSEYEKENAISGRKNGKKTMGEAGEDRCIYRYGMVDVDWDAVYGGM